MTGAIGTPSVQEGRAPDAVPCAGGSGYEGDRGLLHAVVIPPGVSLSLVREVAEEFGLELVPWIDRYMLGPARLALAGSFEKVCAARERMFGRLREYVEAADQKGVRNRDERVTNS